MNRLSLLLSSGLLAGALALGGCPSVSNLTTARTVKPGKHEVHIAPGVVGVSTDFIGTGSNSTAYMPTIDFGYRLGLTDMLDLGIRLSSWGNFGFNVKVGLVDSDPIRLSLDPGIGGVFFGANDATVGYLQLDLPVLLDIYAGESFTFNIGPRYTMLYAWASDFGASASSAAHTIGATVGAEFVVSNGFAMQPHAGFLYIVNSVEGTSPIIFTVGIAFKILIGGRDDDTLPQLDDSDLLPEEEVPVDQPVDDGGVEG